MTDGGIESSVMDAYVKTDIKVQTLNDRIKNIKRR